MQPLNFTPLNAHISLADVRHAIKQQNVSWRIALTIGFLLIVTALTIGIVVSWLSSLDTGAAVFLVLLFGGGVMVIFDVIHQLKVMLRTKRFAHQNGFLFEADILGNDRPGVLFQNNLARIMQALRTPGVVFLEYGNFQLITAQSGRTTFAPSYGYIRLKLPRKLPNIALISRQSRFGMPVAYKKSQTLRLEGNFNEYFTLYAPTSYETDALYIFTPDIMERFMALAKHFSCELVDDELYLYADRSFLLTSPEEINRLFMIANQLLAKFNRQIDYYADERVNNRASNRVATTGQRLQGRHMINSIVFSVIMSLIYLIVLKLIN